MSSGADLFVVCKQCGSEVSPYVTECPYCGHRLRRRAPKLPRGGRGRTGAAIPSLGRLRKGEIPGIRADARSYVPVLLALAGAGMFLLVRASYVDWLDMAIVGQLHGQWWRLFTSQFAYVNGLYAFAAVGASVLFAWLLERRHGGLVVIALFLGSGVAGALAALALYPDAIVSGANAGALALLAAWAAPDVLAAFSRRDYDGDLLGIAAIAGVLLALPLALSEVSWVAGAVGLLFGSLIGLGIAGADSAGH